MAAAIFATLVGVLAIVVFAMGSVGQGLRTFTPVERVLLVACSVLLIWPDLRLQLAGGAMAFTITILPVLKKNRAS
jgi:TRAP-type uncharacterized transport system fused permease subunit